MTTAGTAPRVLLVESLDAAGSDRADARERCAALRALHAVVRIAIMSPRRDGSDLAGADANGTTTAVAECDAGPAGRDRLRAFAAEGHFDLILVAAASPGGGPAARSLPPDVPATWWPTGVSPAPGWGERFGIGRGPRLKPLGAGLAGPDDGSAPGLAWSSVGARPAGRGRLTLWDGEYLLAPLPLAGEDGSRLLAAFAGLDSQWCGLDLVVLSEPQPGFEREARDRGIATRVHFVGRAPREAEWAWWTHASGAVFAGAGPVSGGFVLRGLDAGCPMLTLQSDGPGAAIRAWLERNGCLGAVGADRAGGRRPMARRAHRAARAGSGGVRRGGPRARARGPSRVGADHRAPGRGAPVPSGGPGPPGGGMMTRERRARDVRLARRTGGGYLARAFGIANAGVDVLECPVMDMEVSA